MSERSEKELRKLLTKDYEEIENHIKAALNAIGFKVTGIGCSISTREEGHNVGITIKKKN